MITDLPPDEALFSAFPEWRSLARLQTTADGSMVMLVEVPAPAGTEDGHGLIIEMTTEEITVGFDWYHEHFRAWMCDDPDDGPDAALEFIRQVVTEHVVVVSWWHDDRWCGSSPREPGSELEALTGVSSSRYNRVRVRSWQGSFDIDIEA